MQSGEEKVNYLHSCLPTDSPDILSSKRALPPLPAMWGSLAACHYCIMTGSRGCSPSPVGRKLLQPSVWWQDSGSKLWERLSAQQGLSLTQRGLLLLLSGFHWMPTSHRNVDPRIAPGLLLRRLQGCLRTLRWESAFRYQLCLARALPSPQGRVLCRFCKSGWQ